MEFVNPENELTAEIVLKTINRDLTGILTASERSYKNV